MNKKQKNQLIWVAAVVGIIILVGALVYKNNRPGELDDFARCLEDNGAVFYGAFWCPHCQDQKEMFGNSERLLPYVECSTPSGQGTTSVCQQAGITAYPTWQFADGERITGVLSFSQLSERTGCVL